MTGRRRREKAWGKGECSGDDLMTSFPVLLLTIQEAGDGSTTPDRAICFWFSSYLKVASFSILSVWVCGSASTETWFSKFKYKLELWSVWNASKPPTFLLGVPRIKIGLCSNQPAHLNSGTVVFPFQEQSCRSACLELFSLFPGFLYTL